MRDTIDALLDFIGSSPSPFHTAGAAADELSDAGFQPLAPAGEWELVPGGRYFLPVYGSSLLAFTVGERTAAGQLRIAAAHTDFPGLRVKPAAGIVQDGYGELNVETYGGLMLASWQDRPLSLAGKVVLQGEDAFHPRARLIDLARPLMTIPSLAIHMNRKVNEGVALNRQTEMLPVAAMLGMEMGPEESRGFFQEILAQEIGCAPADILSYELNIYPYETGSCLGFAGEFVSSPRLDNLTSVRAVLDGIMSASPAAGLHMAALFDNEEVGSRTKQGAGSALLRESLGRIYRRLGWGEEALFQDIAAGFMLSVDVAHGLHPNYAAKNDPTNRPVLGSGLVLKQAASQSYAGDAEAVAVVRALCRQHDIPCQCFVNRSDEKGGSTLGSIASALVPIRTMDIGVPLLAMHSARELMGKEDQESLTRLLQVFLGQ